MTPSRHFFLKCTGLILLFVPTAVFGAARATFTELGDLPGGDYWSAAFGVSGDGSVVVGRGSSSSGFEAIRWTRDSGIVGLGYLPIFGKGSSANAVSNDGTVIVGESFLDLSGHAFRWIDGSPIEDIGNLPGGLNFSFAYAVSQEGSAIVGVSWSDRGGEGFHWTSGGGMTGLGRLPGSHFSIAGSISDNGNIVVGQSISEAPEVGIFSEAFRWTSETGMMSLGDLPRGRFDSGASDISGDGSVIVGAGISQFGREAFRWTEEGGMIGLGDLAGGNFISYGQSVSADGSVVVGTSSSFAGQEAYVWTRNMGMKSLRDLLIESGVSGLMDWQLLEATAISADGRTIVGNGINAFGKDEGWIATISIPEPNTLVLSLLSVFFGINRRSAV